MTAERDMVLVWDPLVRIGHWLLAAAFAVDYLTEGEPLQLHVWAGYTIGGIVLLRILWGFVGPRPARFADFLRGPGAALRICGRCCASAPTAISATARRAARWPSLCSSRLR